ncbi:S8 family serine peptidase [Propionibacteriaceae bacterium G1746]
MNNARPRPAARLAAGVAAVSLVCTGLAQLPASADADLGRLSDYVTTVKKQAGTAAVPNKWFVQVSGAPTDDGGSAAQAKSTQDTVLKNARSRGLKVEVTRSFTTSFNGMTVTTSDSSVAELLAIPGVEKVFPVVEVKRPVINATSSATPDMASAINMTGASIAQNELGLSGKNIKIGIIDTGIDIDHPDLGGNGTPGSTPFPTTKVAYGYDFVGDDYNAEIPGSRPVPDNNPDDCEGHGTHVAGIAAADGNPSAEGVRGVAPKATLGAYRVFGCEGSADTDVILAALERAGQDKMDVVNMSLGDSFMSWPQYPTAQATDRLSKKGTIVVASAGNEGTNGLFSGGAPGVAKTAIGVASFDNASIRLNSFTTSLGTSIGYVPASGAPLPPTSGTLKVAVAPTNGCVANGPLPAVGPGTVYLIQRGGCTFHEKALAGQTAGADAVILYNNVAGMISPTVAGTPAITIPVGMITQADGEALAAAAAAGEVTITWTPGTVQTPDPQGGLLSSFSSWGLAADLDLKPDLGAPGGNIWSTVPVEQNSYGAKSGTSMSAPHVAGAVALLLEARPDLKGKALAVRELLQNTSKPADFSFAPGAGYLDMVARQGAGMIDIARAATTKQSVTPGKIALGEGGKKAKTTTLEIKNTGTTDVTYAISNVDGVGAFGPSDPTFFDSPNNVSAPASVVVRAGKTAKVKVTISAPADAPDGYIYGGWVVLTGSNGETLRVPYAGMAGDYQALNPLQDSFGLGFPWLARLDGGDLSPVDGGNFTMQGDDVPFLIFHVEYPVTDLQVFAYKVNADGSKTQLSSKPVLSTGYAGRDDLFTALAWDGTYSQGKNVLNAPAGTYVLELRAIKALGGPNDVQTWTSPSFTIGSGTVDPNLKQIQVDPNVKVNPKR